MRDHPRRSAPHWGVFATWAVVLLTTPATARASADTARRVCADIHLNGQTIWAFDEGGEHVSVIRGPIQLDFDGRNLSAQNAVIWSRPRPESGGQARDVTIYAEGEARLAEGDGTVLQDRRLLLRLRHLGRVSASASLTEPAPELDALYGRALASRQEDESAASQPLPEASTGVAGPPQTDPKEPGSAPILRPKDESAVLFRGGRRFTSKWIGEGEQRQRVTVARGGVYGVRGDPDSDLFLELRCEAAVIFSVPRDDKSSPVDSPAPKLVGGETPLTAAFGRGETVLGAYLEGDVLIARGERTLRGPRAFYDFTTNRAIVVNGVFRTIQEQRNVPIFVRSQEARTLSEKEFWFRDARVTSSDFHSPTYHIAAERVYLRDIAPYDEKGNRLGPEEWEAMLAHTRLNVQGIPISYWPYTHGRFQVGHTSLRKVQFGKQGQKFGYGVETEWEFFRLLGVTRPEGFTGRSELSYYEKGVVGGLGLKYDRPDWSGYTIALGVRDNRQRDDFGDQREDISVPTYRGRLTHRHKVFLPKHWQVQGEFSWYSDRNFPEMFYPAEFHGGKTQETLLYAKNQQDNWAFTTLLQYRLNRFDQQTESAPDLGLFVVGEPLLEDRLTLFSEMRAGIKRWRPANWEDQAPGVDDSRLFPRLDARQEVDWPLHMGPVRVVPYAVVRGTYWDDAPPEGEKCRRYGQVGAKANVHIWRVYDEAESRLWDIHRLKHIITPEVVVFGSDAPEVSPDDLFPIDSGVEEQLRRQSGAAFTLRQRLVTQRGTPGKREDADWMRLDLSAGRFRHRRDIPADGRLFTYRPEYSIGRGFVNADYAWNLSRQTTLLSDGNYDTHTGHLGRASVSLNVDRTPRLAYFGGVRYIRDLDSSVGTVGVNYHLTRKYSVSFFEQYDLDYRGGTNTSTRLVLTRKLPRWFVGLTVVFDRNGEGDDVGVFLALWPQGAPEVKLGSGDRGFLSSSDLN
jgi:hypothetical protein